MASIIKFDIPPAARHFEPFSRLPTEIRHQIWEDAILEPGMNFLHIETEAPAIPLPPSPDTHLVDSDSDNDDGLNEALAIIAQQSPTQLWPATLKPRYPTPKADISNYLTLSRNLAKFSVVCADSRAVVERLTNRPGSVKLKSGRIVSLAASDDVFCLGYLTPDSIRSGCRMYMDLHCEELANIRRVAVPYCHRWETERTTYRCTRCGFHHRGSQKKMYPLHLYEFLARYLPNLETFYFIDYLVVRNEQQAASRIDCSEKATEPKPEPDATLSHKASAQYKHCKKYRSDGRVFVEAHEEEWNVKPGVTATLAWVRQKFTQYATHSKLSKHTHPKDVEFGILACEWTKDQAKISSKSPSRRTNQTSNKEAKKSAVKDTSRGRAVLGKTATTPVPASLPIGTDSKTRFVFGRQRDFGFDFSGEAK